MNSSNNIPDRSTCIELMERYQMLSNIREHYQTVSRARMAENITSLPTHRFVLWLL